MGGDITRPLQNFDLFQVHLVSDPMPGMEVIPEPANGSLMSDSDDNIYVYNGGMWFLLADEKTHPGRIYGKVVSEEEVAAYKYDKAMELLET